jgi:hypothetical protein
MLIDFELFSIRFSSASRPPKDVLAASAASATSHLASIAVSSCSRRAAVFTGDECHTCHVKCDTPKLHSSLP